MGFRFKRFDIDDSATAMKVGTDAVLLGSWVNYAQAASILDVGTGTGILCLMAAQSTENYDVRIDAVETDKGACSNAMNNFKNSPWSERLFLYNGDFAKLTGHWDLIISNPPFFSSGVKSPSETRALARHGGNLNYLTLLDFASYHLNPHGSLAMISDISLQPSEIIYFAEMRHLKLRRICRIYDNERDKNLIRILWQFNCTDGDIEKSELIIRTRDNKTYTDEYKTLTKSFYLE